MADATVVIMILGIGFVLPASIFVWFQARLRSRAGQPTLLAELRDTISVPKGLGYIGTAAFLGALTVLGFQVYSWAKSGEWTPIPVSMIAGFLLGHPLLGDELSGWKGIARIVQWIMDLPISGVLFAMGVCLIPGFAIAEDRPGADSIQ